MNKIGLL